MQNTIDIDQAHQGALRLSQQLFKAGLPPTYADKLHGVQSGVVQQFTEFLISESEHIGSVDLDARMQCLEQTIDLLSHNLSVYPAFAETHWARIYFVLPLILGDPDPRFASLEMQEVHKKSVANFFETFNAIDVSQWAEKLVSLATVQAHALNNASGLSPIAVIPTTQNDNLTSNQASTDTSVQLRSLSEVRADRTVAASSERLDHQPALGG